MSEEESIKFAGLMEDYLNIPSFVCEMIEKQLEDNKYKEVVKYIIQRRNEIESKEDYISQQQAINMWITKLGEKDKEIERLNNQLDFIKDQNKYIDKLEKMVKERNSIIKEAIEYTENNFISYEDSRTFGRLGEEIDIQVKEIRELLNILKGDDKE